MVRVFAYFRYEWDTKNGTVKLIYTHCLHFQPIVETRHLYTEPRSAQELHLKDLAERTLVIRTLGRKEIQQSRVRKAGCGRPLTSTVGVRIYSTFLKFITSIYVNVCALSSILKLKFDALLIVICNLTEI